MKRFILCAMLIAFSVIGSGKFLEGRQTCYAEDVNWSSKWVGTGDILPYNFECFDPYQKTYIILAIIPCHESYILKLCYEQPKDMNERNRIYEIYIKNGTELKRFSSNVESLIVEKVEDNKMFVKFKFKK